MMRVSKIVQQSCVLFGLSAITTGTMGQIELTALEPEFEVTITSEPLSPDHYRENPYRHEGGIRPGTQ